MQTQTQIPYCVVQEMSWFPGLFDQRYLFRYKCQFFWLLSFWKRWRTSNFKDTLHMFAKLKLNARPFAASEQGCLPRIECIFAVYTHKHTHARTHTQIPPDLLIQQTEYDRLANRLRQEQIDGQTDRTDKGKDAGGDVRRFDNRLTTPLVRARSLAQNLKMWLFFFLSPPHPHPLTTQSRSPSTAVWLSSQQEWVLWPRLFLFFLLIALLILLNLCSLWDCYKFHPLNFLK